MEQAARPAHHLHRRAAYPHLAGKYDRYYRGVYAPKDYTREVIASINRIRERYGFTTDRDHNELVTRKLAPVRDSQLALSI